MNNTGRAVFLTASGDPFILSLVMRLYRERWRDEVESFYIGYNNYANVSTQVVQELFAHLVTDDKIRLVYHPKGVGPGKPIADMAHVATEPLVMLLEEDGYIFKPGKVDECFQQIETGVVDALGSPRGSCGPEIWEASKTKYGLDYTGYGDVGPNFWPNFFFCNRSDLLNTDMNFDSKTFKAGEYCPQLDHTFATDNHGDTFVWASMQMRANGVRFGTIPQYHASPDELWFAGQQVDKWSEKVDCGWIHAGSLSAGIGGYITGAPFVTDDDGARFEMETRCAFWKLALAATPTDWFFSLRGTYAAGIERLIANSHLSADRVQRKYNLYKDLMELPV
jgi:hypothetical protein